MKTSKIVIALFAILSTSVFAHTVDQVQPTNVYQAIHNQALSDTLANIAQRSGIEFKINTDLGKEVINQSLVAGDWKEAIKLLLANYNYTMVLDNNLVKEVIITGHKSDGNVSNFSYDNVIIVSQKLTKLGSKYQSMPAGAANAIDLPVDDMMKIEDHKNVRLDLPMGQFNVAHDYTVNENDGSRTWVGYLADEGQGYRVFVSKGAAGVMGFITTPDGSYNIESDGHTNVLVDTSKLQHAGFDGDTLIKPEVAMASATTNDQVIDALLTAVTNADALVTTDTALLNKASLALTDAQTNLMSIMTKQAVAQTAYNNALAAYKANPSVANNTLVTTTLATYNTAKVAYTGAMVTYTTANANYSNANAALNNAKTAAAAALASYSQSVGTTTSSSKPVVDLMVVYTTVGQTQAYAKQRISLLVTASNQAYIDSNINMTLRLVHTEATTYVENNSNSQALSDLSNGVGAFSTINSTRSQYGADLVFLFRPLYQKTAGSCGTTYVEFSDGQIPSANLGFGTIGDGNSVDGYGYYCAVNVFTHEIGHTLGLVHERANAPSMGATPSAYAWGVQGTFGTIMSYNTPVLMYFSTPTLTTQCAGQPCGYASTDSRSSDQTSVVNFTAPIVANFFVSTTAIPVLN